MLLYYEKAYYFGDIGNKTEIQIRNKSAFTGLGHFFTFKVRERLVEGK